VRPRALLALVALVAGAACRQDMHDQPKYKPLARSDFFADRRAARPFVAGTVARGRLREDEALETGRIGGQPVDRLPVPVTAALLERGRNRYETFCVPCHGPAGQGDGLIVQRGFKKPSSFHVDRLRQAPVGYFFDVISNGFGAMADYSAQVPVEDRWAVVAYLRALQLSQHAPVSAVPAARRAELDRSLAPLPEAGPQEGGNTASPPHDPGRADEGRPAEEQH
jgi:mono/diheme cytochrome c family protein